MSSDELMISVRGLGKAYKIAHDAGDRPTTLAESIMRRVRHPLRSGKTPEQFWALRNVDFEVKRGDILGIIGRNGAGKSTLLKLLSRITQPTEGRIELFGRVGSLLEVGTGFHPELTGRENIALNGAILGMTSAEVRRHFDAIVEFAGVQQFIDTPVKRYSSGMHVRLAFAVAAHLDPEILIIDEVLAVGDAEFQRKCLGKIKSVSEQGRTVLFVSHDIAAVTRLCTRAIYLRKGSIAASGAVAEVVGEYFASTAARADLAEARSDAATIHRFWLSDADGAEVQTASCNSPIAFNIDYSFTRPLTDGIAVRLTDENRTVVFDAHEFMGTAPERPPGRFQTRFQFDQFPIAPGEYFVDIFVMLHRVRVDLRAERFAAIRVIGGVSRDGNDYQTFDIGGVVAVTPTIRTIASTGEFIDSRPS